jgi:hypothetical protein
MLFYWIFWRLFDLNPLPYHLLAWALHTFNVLLLYRLLSGITASRFGAGLGALVFGFRANFADIYWSFGTIFELLALLLLLLAVLVYASDMKFEWKIVTVAVLYLFAVKSKEIAITIPAVLLLYEVCFSKHKRTVRLITFYGLLGVFAATFGYLRFLNLGSSAARSDPYYMDFSVLTFGRGYGWYFDHLYGIKLRWAAWFIAAFLLTALFVYRREKRGLFFLGYVFVTLLPVIFLVNHRFEFFWYVPFLGIAGLVAVLIGFIERRLSAFVPVSVIMFTLIAAAHCWREWRASAELIQNQKLLALEYETFAADLRNIPQPPPNATIYFRSVPRHSTPEVLRSATQVILHRTDISPEVVR